MYSVMPARNRLLRPHRSPARPAATSTVPNVSVYPASTHCRSALVASRPDSMAGSATFTTDTLISARKSGMSSAVRMRRWSGVKAPDAGSAGCGGRGVIASG